MTRYRLVTDDDCHHYVIPADKLDHWRQWVGSAAWEVDDVPDYALPVGGSVAGLLTFTDPEIA